MRPNDPIAIFYVPARWHRSQRPVVTTIAGTVDAATKEFTCGVLERRCFPLHGSQNGLRHTTPKLLKLLEDGFDTASRFCYTNSKRAVAPRGLDMKQVYRHILVLLFVLASVCLLPGTVCLGLMRC